MRIYGHELKKLISSVAVWGFIIVCLAFNVLIICNSKNEYADFVGTVAKDTGYRLEDSFYDRLSQFTVSGEIEQYFLQQLKIETDGVSDVFEGYETKSIGEKYIAATGSKGFFAGLMRAKYLALQEVVDEKAKKDESLTLYFAGLTHNRHQFLFDTLMGWLLIEGSLVAALLVLLSIGYENIHGTESLVYSTKKGRQLLGPKFAASLSAGMGAFALLALFTFFVYFSTSEYGGVWNSSVSSLFNFRTDMITGYRPFVTWYSFSVWTYFWAMLGVGAGVVLCFTLIAFGIGILIHNTYIAFFAFLIANAANIVVPMLLPQTLVVGLAIKYLAVFSPVGLWLKHELWFTDGDVDIVWKHFETTGLCISFVCLIVFCFMTVHYFRRKDFT